MKKALVLFAHPFSKKSRVNRTLMETLSQTHEISVHDLYEHYPYFHIDVKKEQRLLREHHLIVWQHPLYWFSMPPLMKLWCDDVLRKEFVFEQNSLQGKKFLLSLTTGGLGDPEGNTKVEESLYVPYQKTIEVCGMTWQPPEVFENVAQASLEDVQNYAAKLSRKILEYSQEGAAHGV